jgi:predicted DNA-binding ribbon-helix-helix protein
MNRKQNLTKTTLVSRNITVLGRRTSIRLEPEMWQSVKEISLREKCSIHDICSLVSLRKKQNTSLTAAIRVFIMLYFRASSTEQGHNSAGHGNFDLMVKRARLNDAALPLRKISQRKRMPDNAIEEERRYA